MADEIEITVSGFFTTHYVLQMATGTLGELTLPAFSTSGVFRSAEGRELLVQRTSWWRGWHELRENGVVLGLPSGSDMQLPTVFHVKTRHK
ncbi:MAG: hypothetical protein V3S14_16655 [Anaerolineae bacterium]